MPEATGAGLLLPVLGGFLLSLAVEQGLRPAPSLFRRPLRAWLVHSGVWLLAFALVLAVTGRPLFSAFLVLAELVFIVLVSNAKRHSLREPFVFADLEYFIDALRHPRLFMPYFSAWRALLTLVVFGAVLFAGLVLESSFRASAGLPAFYGVVVLLLVIAALPLLPAARGSSALTFDAEHDLRRYGLLTCLWDYAWAERRPFAGHPFPFAKMRSARSRDALPHVVIIQSESYFDARRLHPAVHPGIYACFDGIKNNAVQHGLLQVPAWGGNTTRSEFAFLSGLGPDAIGVHRFNPHRRLARQRIPTMASVMREAGYQAICVHPYPIGFNARDVVYPAMGFDRFIDITGFSGAERFGPYVSDAAVTDRVCELLRAATEPLVLFVITMENHGPLHLEKPGPEDANRLYSTPPAGPFDDLTVYLRHVANADRMIGRLQAAISANPRDGLLCWYGDHVPILPEIYAAMEFDDGRTDYAVWRKGGPVAAPRSLDIGIEALGSVILAEAGFEKTI